MKLYIKNDITVGESKYIPNAFFFNKNWLNLVSSTFHYKIKYIFFEDGDVKLIDVKTVTIRKKIKPNWSIKSKRINRVLNKIQKKMGVEHLMVD